MNSNILFNIIDQVDFKLSHSTIKWIEHLMGHISRKVSIDDLVSGVEAVEEGSE